MSRTAIITIAGKSTRFSKSVGYECHKSLYHYKDNDWTILAHQLNLLNECGFDDIILIGGYKFTEVSDYIVTNFSHMPIRLFYNANFADYGSCYSFVLGIEQVRCDCNNLFFIEGDLIFDTDSFKKLVQITGDAITANNFLTDAQTAVVFYVSESGHLKYIYDTKHQKLSIKEPFVKIGNSGQVWKFSDIMKLKKIVATYGKKEFKNTNLIPIVDYYKDIDSTNISIVTFCSWYNCNTIADYLEMKKYIER